MTTTLPTTPPTPPSVPRPSVAVARASGEAKTNGPGRNPVNLKVNGTLANHAASGANEARSSRPSHGPQEGKGMPAVRKGRA